MAEFAFLDPGPLIDGDLELVLAEQTPADPSWNWAPAYAFRMRLPGVEEAGSINLRIGEQEALVHYGGHIGYGVHPEHRGHHYAARAVRLLLPLARRHGLQTVWITCNPDNWASRRTCEPRRTCELAGAALVEIVDLPADNDMYQRGERRKCRYRL